ncbi:MAG: NAD(P)H-binding protein [Myxococcales bacterium]|nr:NAD(P)H-binding protein [Myxococcales bacterium]
MSGADASTLRAVVFGATGYTGQAVVRALRARGLVTTAHIRPDSPKLEAFRTTWGALGAETDSTPWERDALKARLDALRPNAVFSLLGTTRSRESADKKAGKDSSYDAVDVGLSLLALDAASALSPQPRFVYLSSLGVTPSTRNAYLAARAKVEAAIRASGVPFIIARPSFITGPDREERRALERVSAVVADGLFAGLGAIGLKGIGARYGSRTADELAGSLVRLALATEFTSQVVESEAL